MDLPVKVMSMKVLPKKMLYWYTKFTLKPTRHTARLTVSKNLKDPLKHSLSFPETDGKPSVFLP